MFFFGQMINVIYFSNWKDNPDISDKVYELTYIAIPYGAVGRFEREALMVWKEPHMKCDSRAGNQQMDLHNIVQTVLEFHCVWVTIYPNHTANDYR